jgi:hypothetical protein
MLYARFYPKPPPNTFEAFIIRAQVSSSLPSYIDLNLSETALIKF